MGISLNFPSKATAVLISLGVLFALLVLASYCEAALAEEALVYSNVVITMDGIQFGDLIDNPAYVTGFRRTVYELIYDALPTGQTIHLNNLDFQRAGRWPILSILLLALSTAAGYLPFRRRDIK